MCVSSQHPDFGDLEGAVPGACRGRGPDHRTAGASEACGEGGATQHAGVLVGVAYHAVLVGVAYQHAGVLLGVAYNEGKFLFPKLR